MILYDYILKNGNIIDGNNNDCYIADIGIVNDSIKSIGILSECDAKNTIYASGKFITPGFIDAHSHGDLNLFDVYAKNQLLQGITTEITGQCGEGISPNNGKIKYIAAIEGNNFEQKIKIQEINEKSKTYKGFFEYLQSNKFGVNILPQVGHGAIHNTAMGNSSDIPNREQMNKMIDLLGEAMENGAIGMSAGLIYPPGSYTGKEELIELCKIVSKYKGRYSTHLRSEGDMVIEAVKEAIEIAEKTGVRLIISHHKVSGKNNWGKSVETLKLIDDAIKRGVDIWLDQYPYTAGATVLSAIIPTEFIRAGNDNVLKNLEDRIYRGEIKKFIESNRSSGEIILNSAGGFSGVIVAKYEENPEYVGKTIESLSLNLQKDPYDILFDIIQKSNGQAMAVYNLMDEKDVIRIMKYNRTTFGTDATHSTYANPFGHPRAFGTFPTLIKKYVLEKNILTLEEMVYKASGLTAKVAKLKNRGLIKEGYRADINIIDLKKLRINSSYENPNGNNLGFDYVFVNGQIAVKDDTYNGVLAGKTLSV
ncbi:MAG: D-aminoacylase [Fusobacteriaceae bacterium]|jgi:N-acyl-D-amino-acid deacylase|nr:D-aminoacylase [Fusobacteriaceae bacterium]